MFPFDAPENMRKLLVCWCFQGDQTSGLLMFSGRSKGNIGKKRFKKVSYIRAFQASVLRSLWKHLQVSWCLKCIWKGNILKWENIKLDLTYKFCSCEMPKFCSIESTAKPFYRKSFFPEIYTYEYLKTVCRRKP